MRQLSPAVSLLWSCHLHYRCIVLGEALVQVQERPFPARVASSLMQNGKVWRGEGQAGGRKTEPREDQAFRKGHFLWCFSVNMWREQNISSCKSCLQVQFSCIGT